MSWEQAAACRQDRRPEGMTPAQWVEVFFPPTGGSVRRAVQVCQTCPVSTECGRAAILEDEKEGVWGGVPASARLSRRMQGMEHGTVAGANAHYRSGEAPCGPCLSAKADYNRRRAARRKAMA